MKKFLAIYQASAESMQQMANATQEETEAVMAAWMNWKAAHEENVVDFGAPLMPGATLGAATPAGNISGYSVLQAESLEALKDAFKDHPHQDTELFPLIDM